MLSKLRPSRACLFCCVALKQKHAKALVLPLCRFVDNVLDAGKMLIYAAVLRCTDPVLTVAAAVSYGRPVFLSPEAARADANAARKEIIGGSLAAKSDHLATIHAFAAYLQACADLGDRGAQQWCRDSFVSYDAMLGIRDGRCELVNSLLEIGFVNHGVFANTNPSTQCSQPMVL